MSPLRRSLRERLLPSSRFTSGDGDDANTGTYKGMMWEGGHRMVGIMRWLGHIKHPGSKTSAIVQMVDYMTAFASHPLPVWRCCQTASIRRRPKRQTSDTCPCSGGCHDPRNVVRFKNPSFKNPSETTPLDLTSIPATVQINGAISTFFSHRAKTCFIQNQTTARSQSTDQVETTGAHAAGHASTEYGCCCCVIRAFLDA